MIVASTVSMDATIGTLCVAGPGDDPGRVYFRDLGGFAGVLTRQVGGWSPSERVDAAVRTIAETMEPPPRCLVRLPVLAGTNPCAQRDGAQ